MDSSSSSSLMIKPRATFSLTPHKISLCILLQVYSPPSHLSLPFPFSSISQHNSLALFLLSHIKSFASPFEPSLSSLISQLKLLNASLSDWLIHHLTNRLASFSSADDLLNFFIELRGILGGPDSGVLEDDCIALDPCSQLGLFVRRCCLSFNTSPLEYIFHLVDAVFDYCKDEDSNYEGEFVDYENMEVEGYMFDKMCERKGRVPFHLHTPASMIQPVEEFGEVEASNVSLHSEMVEGEFDSGEQVYLHGNWQIQGYLAEQADMIEKQGSSFSFNEFENILDRIEKLAPELHRVKYLRYLNSLYHDDYPAAMENLMCYFDSTAGLEGVDSVAPASAGGVNFGRYEIALLGMGMMHFHFGHPKQALGVLTEAVRYSQQQSNDTCLAYILAAICNLLSEFGFSTTSGILGSSCTPMGGSVTSFSVQQQLLVLLKSSLKRAENLNLKRLVTSNHLAMAKFELKHVQRPLLSFGPKASMLLRTCPVDACKELRLCSRLICEYGSESSSMSVDGAFSTTWLKNLHKPTGSLVLSEENVSGQGTNGISFFSLPSSIPGSISQLVGTSYLLRATAWESYGSAPLARINALLYATCYSDTSSLTDLSLAYSKFITHLAVYNGYKEAFAALVIAENKFPSISKSRIQIIKLQLLHECALHRGDLKLAQQVCDELGVMASCVTGVDMDLKVEASLRHARTLLAANQFSQAADVAHSLFCICYKFNMHVENATVLILLAEIQKRSGNAVLGIPYALAGLSFCQSFNLDLLKASATLTLAELWLSLGWGHAKRALTLLHGALPMILGHGGLELRARAHIAEAKCYLSDPTFSISEDPDVVLDPLTQAADELQVLEYHELAAEAFYIKAIVSDKLGQLEEREEAAVLFKRHLTALENPQQENDSLVDML